MQMILSWLGKLGKGIDSKLLMALIPAIVYVCGVMYFITDDFCLYDFPLDDAWIHRVYSSSFAFGHGFEYNDGVQEAGSTSPLWAMVSSPGQWLEILGPKYVALAVKFIGVLFGLIAVQAVYRIGKMITGSGLAGMIAGSLFAIEPRLLFSSLSGMETVLLIALWTSACYGLLGRKYLLSMVLLGLTPVTRPEAMVIVLPLVIVGAILSIRDKERGMGSKIAWVIPWIPMLGWSVFCRFTNGHWLPNTFYLKARPFHVGVDQINMAWESLCNHGFASLNIYLAGVGIYLVWCLFWKKSLAQLSVVVLVFPAIGYLLGVVGTRNIVLEGYYWTRWVDPASLMLTVPFCLGCAIIISGIANQGLVLPSRFYSRGKYRVLVGIIGGIGLAGLLCSGPSFYESLSDRRSHLATDSRAINIINVQAGQWINRHTPADATVGVNDAGAIRYFGQRRTIDLMGLNNADIAFKKVSWPQVLEEADWLAIFPSWFSSRNRLSSILVRFDQRTVIQIAVEEYTICNAVGQTCLLYTSTLPTISLCRPRWSPYP